MIAEFARRHIARGAGWGRIVGLTSGGALGFPEEVCIGEVHERHWPAPSPPVTRCRHSPVQSDAEGLAMRVPRLRLRWIAAAVVLVLVVAAVRLLDSATWIDYYRVVDHQTLLVGTVSGEGATVRVTNVTEAPTTVTITVSTFYFQLGPGTSVGIPYESVAKLQEPLGSRTVIDGSSGLPVQRATCPPPSVFAPVCP